MKKVKLKDIVKISKGKKPISVSDSLEKGYFRFIQIEDLRNNQNIKYAYDSKAVIANNNDILIAWDGANAGTIGSRISGIVGSTIAKLTVLDKSVNDIFLTKFLQSKFDYFRKNCTGATIPHISRDSLINLEIPLPPLEEQKRIAQILDKADEIIKKRERTIKLLDEFLKSTFLEMFGDPVTNPKKQKLIQLGGLCKMYRKAAGNNTAPYIGMESVESETGRILVSEEEAKQQDAKATCFEFNKSHILYGKLRPYLNKVAIPEFSGRCSTELVPLLPEKGVSRIYLAYLIRNKSIADKAMSSNKGTRMPRADMNVLLSLMVPEASNTLQAKFEETYYKITSLKQKEQKAQDHSKTLFNSLTQKAFRGEL